MAQPQPPIQLDRQPIIVQDAALVQLVADVVHTTPKAATQLLTVLPNIKQLAPSIEDPKNLELYKKLLLVRETVAKYHANKKLEGSQTRHPEQWNMESVLPPQQVQSSATVMPMPFVINNKIHDPEDLSKTVSTNPAAHADPGPIPWQAPRATLTGGFPTGLQDGTPSAIQPPADDPALFVADIRPTSLRKNQGVESHVRKKIQDLVATVDPTVKVDADAEDLLLEIADEFIDSVANFASRLAKHRGVNEVELRDLQLHLEMHHGIRIPGFSVDPPSQVTAQTAGGAVASGSGGGGGTKKGGAPVNAGSGAAVKRGARLAAVTQVKKESRLL